MTDKERYATVTTWAKVFQEEGVEVTYSTILTRLRNARVIGETARGRAGRLLRDSFYAESEVRRLLANLLQELPQADEKGIIERSGEIYGTIRSLSTELGISFQMVRLRISKSSLRPEKGRDKKGHYCNFYSLLEVKNICEDQLLDLPQADENGLFEKDGEIFGTSKSFARLLSISPDLIQSRIQKSSAKAVRGKVVSGNICDFFSLTDVKKFCEDAIQDFPQADENGFFEKGGETYGIIASISRLLNLSKSTIELRIKKSSLKPMRGKTLDTHQRDFYPLLEVKRLCSNLLVDTPQANEEDSIEKDGVIYRTIEGLAAVLGVSPRTIDSRIKMSSLKPLLGKTRQGNLRDFYPVSEAEILCADLIAKRKKE